MNNDYDNIKKIDMIARNINLAMKDVAKETAESVGKKTVQFMRDYIQENWYDEYSPKSYERTYALINSLTYKVEASSSGKTWRVIIYWNDKGNSPYALQPIKRGKGEWNAHMNSFSSEEREFTSKLIEWIDKGGFVGGNLSNPRSMDTINGGIGVTEAASEELVNIVNEEVGKKVNFALRDRFGKFVKKK